MTARSAASAAALLLLAAAVQARAEEGAEPPPGAPSAESVAPEEEAIRLEPVIVTAAGHESEMLETPHAVVVLDRERIERRPDATVGDALRGEPGVAVRGDGAWGADPVLRALKKEQIVVAVDGVRVNAAQPQGAIASLVGLGQVERIEVVKGPASVLYGSGAMGGVVNLIAKKRGYTEDWEAHGRASGDAGAAQRGGGGAGSIAATGPWAVLEAAGSAVHYDDYEAPGGVVDRTGYEEWSASGRLKLRVTDSQDAEFRYQRHRADDVWYPGSARDNPIPFAGRTTLRSPRQERELYQGDYELRFGGDWDARLAVTGYDQRVARRVFAYSEPLRKDFVRAQVDFETLGGGARFDFWPLETHHVTAGSDLWRTEASPKREIDLLAITDIPIRNDPFRDGALRSLGFYAQDEIFLDAWTIVLGVRYDQVRGDASQTGFGPTFRNEGLKKTDDTVSWTAGVVFHAHEAFNPYVSVAEGYRAADLRERFEDSARGDGFVHRGDPKLDPERNLTAEAGARGAFETFGRTSYELSAYHSWIRDFIGGRVTDETDPLSGLPIKQTENLGLVTLLGAELSVDHDFGRDIHAYALGSLVFGRNHEDHEPLAEVPPPEFTVGAAYRPALGFRADVSGRFVARQGRVGRKFTNFTENTTESFATWDILLGYRLSDWADLRAGVTNVFDEEYHEHLTEGVSGEEIPARGRNFFVGATVSF